MAFRTRWKAALYSTVFWSHQGHRQVRRFGPSAFRSWNSEKLLYERQKRAAYFTYPRRLQWLILKLPRVRGHPNVCVPGVHNVEKEYSLSA